MERQIIHDLHAMQLSDLRRRGGILHAVQEMTTRSKFSKPQCRALDLLELNEFKRTSEGWATPDGSFVALITMKSLRRQGLAVRSPDRLRCHITEKGRAARS